MLIFCVWLTGCEATDAASARLLTRRDPEPAGNNCIYGGVAIRAGVDRDGDGALDADEIQHIDYVCDDGKSAVRKDRLAPTPECPTGGVAVHTGVDVNRDGVLEGTEITQTTQVCNPAELWDGDFTADNWANPANVTALQGVHVVVGSLEIDGDTAVRLQSLALVTGNLHVRGSVQFFHLAALQDVEGNVTIEAGRGTPFLAGLEHIGGDLVLAGDAQDSPLVDAPALRDVAGSVRFGEATRGELSLGDLRTIGQDLTLEGQVVALQLDRLASIGHDLSITVQRPLDLALPSLQAIGGTLGDSRLGALTALRLAHLEYAGNIKLSGESLTTVSIPSRHSVGDLEIVGVPALTTIELGTTDMTGTLRIGTAPGLTTLSLSLLSIVRGGGVGLGPGIDIGDTGLETVELPLLVEVNGIEIGRNPALTAVRLPSLTRAVWFEVSDNDHVTNISAPELASLDRMRISRTAVCSLDFGKLTSVTDSVRLEAATLPDLSGLHSLESTQVLALRAVAALHDFRGLAAIRHIRVLSLARNPTLASLDGLEPLTELSGVLDLYVNPALASISALRNVTRIGRIDVQGGQALDDLALPALTAIDNDMIVFGTAVQDLSGLAAVRSVGGPITLTENANLSDEEIAAFLRQIGRLPEARRSPPPL
jgi:hypothetical protein